MIQYDHGAIEGLVSQLNGLHGALTGTHGDLKSAANALAEVHTGQASAAVQEKLGGLNGEFANILETIQQFNGKVSSANTGMQETDSGLAKLI